MIPMEIAVRQVLESILVAALSSRKEYGAVIFT